MTSLTPLRRGDADWSEQEVEPGGAYETDLLPGLVLDLGAFLIRTE